MPDEEPPPCFIDIHVNLSQRAHVQRTIQNGLRVSAATAFHKSNSTNASDHAARFFA
jgi:hypothetical protein